jgi:hypothetical protein
MSLSKRVPSEGIPWPAIHQTKAEIDQLTLALGAKFLERRALMRHMASAGMGQREIGAYWGVSQVAVHFALNGRQRQ